MSKYNIIINLIKIIPKYLSKNLNIKFINTDIYIEVLPENLIMLMNYLKNNWALQYKTLSGITAVDYPEEKKRFKIFYILLSYKLNNRIIINTSTTDKVPIDSITSIYRGANWYEREVWDMFGIYFINHPDLRRILTDYGFEGFPFRKDFPQTGFLEVRYDDGKKCVLYEEVELAQEYRFFKYLNPWSNIK